MEFFQQQFKVMIICDDPDTSYMWQHLLQRQGIEVVLMNTGSSLVIEKNEPDLIIIDEVLEKIEGIKIVQDIKPKTISPILLLTT